MAGPLSLKKIKEDQIWWSSGPFDTGSSNTGWFDLADFSVNDVFVYMRLLSSAMSLFLEIFWHPPSCTIWHWHTQARQIANRACLLMNPIPRIISVTTVSTKSCILNSLPVSFEWSQLKVILWYPEDQLGITDYGSKCHGSHHPRLRSRVLHGVPSGSLDMVPVMEMVQVTTLCWTSAQGSMCPWVTCPQTLGHGPWGEISLC